jgi:hypothetical protein
MSRAMLLFAGIAAAAAVCAAQPGPERAAAGAQVDRPALGRLFYTPAERAALDVARLQKPVAQAAAEAPKAPPPPQVVSYGGIVRRSDGKSMLWINNRLVDEKEALAGLSLKGKVRPDGAVTLQVPETGRTIEIKVGQSVEVQTGKVAETRKPRDDAKSAAGGARTPADAKGAPAETKGAGGDAKSPPPEPKSAAADPKAPGRAPDTPSSATAPGTVGLKPDLGTRGPPPAEEQQLRSRGATQ